MPPTLFFLASAAGALLWNTVLVSAGYFLADHYDRVESILDPVTILVLVAVVALYLWRVVTWKPGRSQSPMG